MPNGLSTEVALLRASKMEPAKLAHDSRLVENPENPSKRKEKRHDWEGWRDGSNSPGILVRVVLS